MEGGGNGDTMRKKRIENFPLTVRKIILFLYDFFLSKTFQYRIKRVKFLGTKAEHLPISFLVLLLKLEGWSLQCSQVPQRD